MIVSVILLSLFSGLLYRLGGVGRPFNTKIRDFGCPIVALFTLKIMGLQPDWWIMVITFGAMFGAMTTYCTPKGQEDVKWHNWLLTGLLYGFTAILYGWQFSWLGFGLRVLSLGALITLWSELISNAKWEERGRGFLFNITLPLLLIGG